MPLPKKLQSEIAKFTPKMEWKCIDSSKESECLYYSRFFLAPLRKGQGETIGTAIRRVLLEDIKGTSITRVKFQEVDISHEYSRINGVEESVHEILLNFKKIVLRSRNITDKISKASIRVRGPACVTAKDIKLPPSVVIENLGQHILHVTSDIEFSIQLEIERHRGFKEESNPQNKDGSSPQDGSFPLDNAVLPIRQVNFTIHDFGKKGTEILFLEVWSNGSVTPVEAVREASITLIGFFITFIQSEEEGNLYQYDSIFYDPPQAEIPLSKIDRSMVLSKVAKLRELYEKTGIELPFRHYFIDQLGFSWRTYHSLKERKIDTIMDITRALEDINLKSNPGQMMEIFIIFLEVADDIITLYQELPPYDISLLLQSLK